LNVDTAFPAELHSLLSKRQRAGRETPDSLPLIDVCIDQLSITACSRCTDSWTFRPLPSFHGLGEKDIPALEKKTFLP
jgi:hypothetical protein